MKAFFANTSLCCVAAVLAAIIPLVSAQADTPAAATFTATTSASPTSVASGTITTITSALTNTGAAVTGTLIVMQVNGPSNTQVAQKVFPGKDFMTGDTQKVSYDWTAASAAGAYTVTLLVMKPDWSSHYFAQFPAATITVTEAVLAPAAPKVAAVKKTASRHASAKHSARVTLAVKKDSSLGVPAGAWIDPAYGAWHSCVMGGGGYLLNTFIAPSDPKRIYMHGDMDGLFRSDDAGNTWRMIHGGLDVKDGHYEYAGVAVNPENADDVAVALGSGEGSQKGIFVSENGGQNWAKTLDVRFYGNGPFRWAGSRIAGPHQKSDLLVTASEGTGVWRSEDKGHTWQDCGLKGIFFTDVYFDRTDPDRIWLCAAPVQMDSTASGNLSGGEYRSDDGGKTWAKLGDDSPFEVMQDPVNGHVLYGLCDTTVKRSVDMGASWQDFSDGLPVKAGDHLGIQPFRAIGVGPDFTLIVQNDTKMIYRLDSGQSQWQSIKPKYELTGWRLGFSAPPANDASSISVAPTDRNHWYLTDEFGFYQSWNAGKTWMPSNHGIETTVIHAITQDPQNASNVYLGAGDVGFWWSDTAGKVMTQTNSSTAGWVGNIKCIDASAKLPSRVYAVGGVGWKSDTVYVSTDGGKSVSKLSMQGTGLPEGQYACDSIAVDPNDPNSVFLATSTAIGAASGGVYHSADGGKSWTWMGQGLPLGKTIFNENIWWGGRELAISPDGTLLAISASCGSAYKFDKTSGTWFAVPLPPVGGIYSVAADLLTPGRFYICEIGDDSNPGSSSGGLFRTDDDGSTWQKLVTGSVHAVAVDRGVQKRVAVSGFEGVSLSTDGGDSWTLLQKLPNRGFYDCLAFAGNHVLAGTGGNGAFWLNVREAKVAQAK